MKRIEKSTWYSRVEEILARDFGNIYSKLTSVNNSIRASVQGDLVLNIIRIVLLLSN